MGKCNNTQFERKKQNKKVCRNKNRLGWNCTRGSVANHVQDDVGKGAACDTHYSPAEFQFYGVWIQQQIVTDELSYFAN